MKNSRTTKKLKTRIGLTVGAVLVCIGLVLLGGLVLPSLYGWWRLRDGVEVKATILEFAVGDYGGRPRQHTEVKVQYQYEYQSTTYESDQVSVLGYSDLFYHELKRSWERGLEIPVVVVPEDPAVAAYDREFRWWPLGGMLVFISVFVGLGSYLWCWNRKAR